MSRTSNADPTGTSRSSPSITPISTPRITPITTPICTPLTTPICTPLSTPQGTPINGTPINGTPQGTPQGTPKIVQRLFNASQRKLDERHRIATAEQLVPPELNSPEDEPRNIQSELEMSYTNLQQTSVEAAKRNIIGKGAFLNLAFSDLDDDKNITMEKLKLMTADTEHSLNESFLNWSTYMRTLQKNRKLLHSRIEQRKQQVLQLINEHALSLHEQLDESMQSHLELGSSMTSFLESALQRTRATSQGINSENNADVNKQDIFQDMQEIRDCINNNIPIWLPLDLKHGGPQDYLAKHLFGTIQIVQRDLYPVQICERVDLIRSFNVKTKWDEMPCAIVDMAVTSDGDVLVCDKNSKLLKMFDSSGRFKMLIGQGQVKDPTRVIALQHTNSILVTDNAMRRIKMYHKNGSFVCDFICEIKYPTSLCENYKGDIIVVEFESRSIVIYHPDGQVINTFKCQLPNPTHITCTPAGDIIVTDWRNHAVRAFHVDGEMAWRWRDRGTADTQMEQPQGITADTFGNIIVADYANHRIQIYDSSNGKHRRVLIPKGGHGLKLPMVVDTSANGELFVGEYQGGVKVFKYLDKVEVPLPNSELELMVPTGGRWEKGPGEKGEKEEEEREERGAVKQNYLRVNDVKLLENEAETSI